MASGLPFRTRLGESGAAQPIHCGRVTGKRLLDVPAPAPDRLAMEIRTVRTGEAAELRAVRLRALLDSPEAFGAVHAEEERLPDSAWVERAEPSEPGDERVTFVAESETGWVGMAMSRLERSDPSRAGLYGLWVEPAARGGGVGRALTEAVVGWAQSRKAGTLSLWVVVSNAGAIGLYRRLGFRETGRTMLLARDPSIVEIEMELALGASPERVT